MDADKHRASGRLLPWIRERIARGDRVIGVHGSQGSGKSTACAELERTLASEGLRVVTLSIDDLYLSRAHRRELSQRIHPLLMTRGVPGTHDVELGRRTLKRLCVAGRGGATAVPRFDKTTDDRTRCEHIDGAVDVVLFEGWCLGLPALPPERLAQPFNDLERSSDADGIWRRYVAGQLSGPYRALWGDLDSLAALIAPDLATVVNWRTQAEVERRTSTKMSPIGDIATFVAHYARWTAWGIEAMPEHADLCLWLDAERRVVRSQSSHRR